MERKTTLIDTRCTRKAVTTTAGMGNPRLFQLCACASISLFRTQRHTYMYTHISTLHILSSALSTSFCALWHLFKPTSSQEDKARTSPVHSIVNIHMYFQWVHTPFSHFHMCKEALKQFTSTSVTTRTLPWHFFFHLQHHASICRGHSVLFIPTFWPRVGKAEGWKSFFSHPPHWKDMPKQAWYILKWQCKTFCPSLLFSSVPFCLLSRHLTGSWVYFAFSTDISSIKLSYILAYRLTHTIHCSHS